MARRFSFSDPAPEHAESYKSLKWVFDPSTNVGKVWRGKQQKPFAHYRFKSKEQFDQFIVKHCASEDAGDKYKVERAEKRAAGIAEMQSRINVGTILHYSWGYDQTNCEFYQVVAKAGRRVTLRAIG